MLQRLAGKPKILNTVSVLSASGADLGRQAADYVAGYPIHCDERFASNPMQGGETPLADSRFLRDLSSEPEFGGREASRNRTTGKGEQHGSYQRKRD
ncbi:MAG: hypothetical protein WCA22_05665 [Candidatus Binatus sp.]